MMLRKTYLPLLLLIGFIAVGCGDDDVEDILTVTKEGQISGTVSVATETQTTFAETMTFDLSADSDVTQFGDKIDSYSVDSLTLEFKNYTGDADITLVSTSVLVQDKDGNTLASGDTPADLNLKDLDDGNALVIFKFPASVAESIVEAIQADGVIKVTAVGEVSAAPVAFDVEATLYFQVTGSLVN